MSPDEVMIAMGDLDVSPPLYKYSSKISGALMDFEYPAALRRLTRLLLNLDDAGSCL